jgi:hypothetical protein
MIGAYIARSFQSHAAVRGSLVGGGRPLSTRSAGSGAHLDKTTPSARGTRVTQNEPGPRVRRLTAHVAYTWVQRVPLNGNTRAGSTRGAIFKLV